MHSDAESPILQHIFLMNFAPGKRNKDTPGTKSGDSGLFGKDERDGRQTADRHPAWEIDHDHHHHKGKRAFWLTYNSVLCIFNQPKANS